MDSFFVFDGLFVKPEDVVYTPGVLKISLRNILGPDLLSCIERNQGTIKDIALKDHGESTIFPSMYLSAVEFTHPIDTDGTALYEVLELVFRKATEDEPD